MFIAKIPHIQNSHCKHDINQSTTWSADSPLICHAGHIVYIKDCDGETAVIRRMDVSDQYPFGFIMQDVRTRYNYEYVPHGGIMQRDKGTQRAFIGGPVGVAHGGIWSTDVYDTDVQINAGDLLYCSASGTLVKSTGWGMPASGILSTTPVAQAINTLSTARLAAKNKLHIKALI